MSQDHEEVLLIYCSSTAHMLLVYCSCAAHVLLMYCSFVTHVLLICYSCTAVLCHTCALNCCCPAKPTVSCYCTVAVIALTLFHTFDLFATGTLNALPPHTHLPSSYLLHLKPDARAALTPHAAPPCLPPVIPVPVLPPLANPAVADKNGDHPGGGCGLAA